MMGSVVVWTCVLLFGGTLVTAEALSGNFFMIGDVHLDLTYRGTSDSCLENYPLDQLGPYGHYECDSPYELVDSAVAALKDEYEKSNADFVVWMGDSPAHKVQSGEWTRETFLFSMRNASRLMQQHLENAVVLPVIGNHDYFPRNQLPGENSDIYDEIADMWQQWLPVDLGALETFKNGGFYTLPISSTAPKLRAIVLNTNLYLSGNKVTRGQTDPGNQLRWLESELQKAVDNDEKVHLILHIPTGAVEVEPWGEFYIRSGDLLTLNNIMRKYSDVILGSYGTHVHSDTYKMYYDSETGAPVGTIFISPSVTPWRWYGSNYSAPRNPALRRFDFDPQSLQLTDIKQFYLKLPDANSGADTAWQLEYSFTDAFDVPDVGPAALDSLLKKFKQGDDALFKKYTKYNVVSINPADTPYYNGICGCQCKVTHLCSIEYVDRDPWKKCMEDVFSETCGASANRLSWFAVAFVTFITARIGCFV